MSDPEPDSRRDETISRLTDLHYAIFAQMPTEGTKLGWSEMVVTVPHLRDKLNSKLGPGEPKLTSSYLQAEVRALAQFGLAVRVTTLSGSTKGWQKTKLAAQALEDYQARTAEIVRDQTPVPAENYEAAERSEIDYEGEGR